uniref:aldehyde dehydrogenase, cytosolic 1-like n=1 Tax=Myodes glareolus TaxID=447135 RepID=UPI002021F79F|nr:aldehyde dehydrogenase, cytosolic 1-like [Myodes glareolus]
MAEKASEVKRKDESEILEKIKQFLSFSIFSLDGPRLEQPGKRSSKAWRRGTKLLSLSPEFQEPNQQSSPAQPVIPAPLANLKIQYTKIFINNEWHDSVRGKKFPVFNPATEEIICRVEEGDKADVDKTVKAFQIGSPWRTMNASERGRLLNKLADLLERDHLLLATMESMNTGKVFPHAYMMDIEISIKALKSCSVRADKVHGQTIPSEDNAVEFAHQGVVFHQGQMCIAASRLFVEESIYDEFVKRSVEWAKKYVLGNPLSAGINQGPQFKPLGQSSILVDRVQESMRLNRAWVFTEKCGG